MTSTEPSDPGHRRPTGAGGASGELSPAARAGLLEVLERAQRLGFLGPAPVEPQIDHALRFRDALQTLAPEAGVPAAGLDLGSGGGLPGLVLASAWPESSWVLLEATERRVVALVEAIELLGLGDRVVVDHRRAEDAGQDPDRRASFDLVTARSFGPPAVAAECGAPLLRQGGLLVVSDPPDGPGRRWPAAGLALLGLEVVGHHSGCTVLRSAAVTDHEYPRRVGVPAKKPLFGP